MNKLSIVATTVLLSLGICGAVTPSFAASVASCQDDVSENNVHNGAPYESYVNTNATAIAASLQAKGIDAQSVTDWGGCVEAQVLHKNGSTAMEFFDPGTLQRLHVNG